MNASLPFCPPINTDIDYYQALFFLFFILVNYATIFVFLIRGITVVLVIKNQLFLKL